MTIERCHITFENFWGEDLNKVRIIHDISDLHSPVQGMYLYNVKNLSTTPDALSFFYRVEDPHHWIVEFVTQSGKHWRSSVNFTCQIKPEDNHQVILGINGESKRLYAAFPASSSCSTELFVVWWI
nr:hypothetical protein [Providencia rustigianii]